MGWYVVFDMNEVAKKKIEQLLRSGNAKRCGARVCVDDVGKEELEKTEGATFVLAAVA